jgi:hypothetical protein
VCFGTISNGYNNCVSASNYYVTIGNGKANEIQRASQFSTIINGTGGLVRDSEYATLLNGRCNAMCAAGFGTSSGFYTCNYNWGARVHGTYDMGLASQGNAQYFDVVFTRQTTDDTPTIMYLDGLAELFATQADKMYTINVKAQGFADNGTSIIGQDLFGIFTTDGSNNVTREHRSRYADYCTGAFTVSDIDLSAGAGGTIDINVTGLAANNVNWIAYVWGVEVIKPAP